MIKLSIIIPVYNAGKFVRKSYDQILGQDLDDFEIIYVNNNSTDNSISEIEKLGSNDSRIRLLHETKQGAACARNKGIFNAEGSYIYIFDIDDEIYIGSLKRMMEVLDFNIQVDAVFGKMVKSNKGIKNTIKPSDETHEVVINEPPYWGLYWFESLRNVVGPPAFLYRKKVFNHIGFYNEELRNDEDTALDIRLGMSCVVAFVDSYVYLYYKHSDSTIQKTKRNEKMIFHTWRRFVKEHLQFYFNNQVPKRYKEILFRQLFTNMGKIIYYTEGFANRNLVFKQIKVEIAPIIIPLYLQVYLYVLVLFPISYVLKFYVYYLGKNYADAYVKSLS